MRVVPNLYPAFEHQEVIVHTPRHVRSIAGLGDEELGAVAVAWSARLQAARDAGFGHPLLFLNEGSEAGASLAHSHSQLVWLREAPPEVAVELSRLRKENCALCALATDGQLELELAGDLSLHVAPAGRAPYEMLVFPRAHGAQPTEEALGEALALLRDSVRRLHSVEGPVPLNAWLHTGGHWHLEIVPRLTVLAGLELGAGLYVNWLAPEEAADRLRTGFGVELS